MYKRQQKYRCGKRKKLVELGQEGTLISGVRVRQHKDYSFTWDMAEYASNKMSYIEIPRGFLSDTTELDAYRMSQVLTSNGQIGWIGGSGRPDVAAGHSIIAGQYKDKKPDLITQCNLCVKQCKENSGVHRVWPIKPEDLRLVTFVDS